MKNNLKSAAGQERTPDEKALKDESMSAERTGASVPRNNANRDNENLTVTNGRKGRRSPGNEEDTLGIP